MYNRNNKKTVLNSVYLPPLKLHQKSSMMSIRSRRFDLLPVIQEEEGNIMDEIELNNYLFDSNALNKKSSVKKIFNTPKKSEESLRIKSNMKLPPLTNINCLINMEMKHSQSLWDNSFSKKLINGRNIKDNIKSPRANEKNSLFTTKTLCKKSFTDFHSFPVEKLGQARNVGDTNGGSLNTHKHKTIRKRRTKSVKNNKNTLKEESIKSLSEISLENVSEPKATLTTNIVKQSSIDTQMSEKTQKMPSFSKNQRFLSECVKSILDCNSTEVSCEHCEETFPDSDKLSEHMKLHEDEKQECLLCGELFYSGNDFVQHLLSHEGVDKFSCKKCKKYFPSLKTYRVHCQKVHLIPSAYSNSFDQRIKHVKEWLPKFECVRCEAKYSTEEALEAHKKVHARQDLVGAYLLSSQGIVR